MDNQKDYENNSGVDDILSQFNKVNGIEEQPSEEIDFKKVKFVGNATYNTSGVDEVFEDAWKKAFDLENGENDGSSEVDQSYSNVEKFSNIIETIENVAGKYKNKAMNSDTWKTVSETLTTIKKYFDDIVLLSDPMLEVSKELEDRGINHPIVDALNKEIEEIKELQGYDFDRAVKQLIGKKVVEIGKVTIKGAVSLGFNMIGASVKGIRKVIDGVNELGNGSIKLKAKDSKIKQKREEIKRSKDYDIIGDDEEIEQNEEIKYDHGYHGDIPFDIQEYNYRYDEKKQAYFEIKEDYNKKTKKDNFVKRTIKGVKSFGNEIKQTYKASKVKLGRLIIKAGKKIDNTKTRANQIKNDTVKVATGIKNDVVDMAKDLKDDAIQIANDTKDKYEQAKDIFTKRKNDTLLKVLMAGGNFSKQLLEKIQNTLYTKQEKLQIKNEQIAQRNEARKENGNKQPNTLEM